MENTPKAIYGEYEKGANYKSSLGNRGLYEQNKVNERFYVGDQWYGANCGNDRPLVRHNIVKRIGEYKIAVVGASDVSVVYAVEGFPHTKEMQEKTEKLKDQIAQGQSPDIKPEEEVTLAMSALSDYYRTTAERVKFNDLKNEALRDAYIGGTGVMYTYWDADIETGLYLDEEQTAPIKGDIASEIIPIENVYFGDPNTTDVQKQPYIIIAQRRSVKSVRDEAKRNKRPQKDIDAIKNDSNKFSAGVRSEKELEETKTTVLTKFWKENGRVKAIRVTETAVVRPEWDMRVRLYPLAAFRWENRKSSAYGDSEITYLVPNQIAINRMLTASVWAVMLNGMPLTIANEDILGGKTITNDPGQIIRVNAGSEGLGDIVRYINPPNVSNLQQHCSAMISDTLQNAGATDAALGNIRPENTSAIIAAREAATTPLQMVQNRFYSFIEDVARIWADFWFNMYGQRSLKINDSNGTWYLPFDCEKYKNLIITAKVDVGASTLWSETQTISVLDSLLSEGLITKEQYLNRMPKGIIPDIQGLIRDMANEMQGKTGNAPAMDGKNLASILAQLPPDQQAKFAAMDEQTKVAVLQKAGLIGGM